MPDRSADGGDGTPRHDMETTVLDPPKLPRRAPGREKRPHAEAPRTDAATEPPVPEQPVPEHPGFERPVPERSEPGPGQAAAAEPSAVAPPEPKRLGAVRPAPTLHAAKRAAGKPSGVARPASERPASERPAPERPGSEPSAAERSTARLPVVEPFASERAAARPSEFKRVVALPVTERTRTDVGAVPDGDDTERTRVDLRPVAPERTGVPGPPPEPDELVAEHVFGDSLLRRVGHGALRALHLSDELPAIAESGAWVQRPITTGRRIAVSSLVGGAGKSTVSSLIAAVFARYRRDRVLALDVDRSLGSLPLRLGIKPRHSLGDLARAGVSGGSFDQVEPYLSRAGERLWALPGTLGGLGGDEPHAGIYETAGVPLSRFFVITITDTGSGPFDELMRAVLAAAQAHVLVAPATSDGAAGAGRVLDRMKAGGLGELLPRTVVVFTVHTPHLSKALDLDRAAEILADEGVAAVRLGYDRHIAVGSALSPDRLAFGTRATAVHLAARVLRQAIDAGRADEERRGTVA